jgi:glycerol kinase
LQAGLYTPPDVFAQQWAVERRFSPTMAAAERERKLSLWRDAVRRTLKKA